MSILRCRKITTYRLLISEARVVNANRLYRKIVKGNGRGKKEDAYASVSREALFRREEKTVPALSLPFLPFPLYLHANLGNDAR